jgi:hypothetical protein
MTAYGDKLRSLGFLSKKGTSNKKPVIDERTGKVGGFHEEHWDDSQDATVLPQSIHVEAKLIQEER